MAGMTTTYTVRFTHEQIAQLKAGAEATYRPVANFVRWASVKAASEVLAQQREQSKLGGLESARNETKA